MKDNIHFVFGYGSLVNIDSLENFLDRNISSNDWQLCNLNGFRRSWNIAMDNSLNIKDYKYYIDFNTGCRPKIFVTFLNIYKAKNESINGIIFMVSSTELKKIDQRERSYFRINVNRSVDLNINYPCWTYIGLQDAENIYKKALPVNKSYINVNYYKYVIDAFSMHGKFFLNRFLESTDTPEAPFLNLKAIYT